MTQLVEIKKSALADHLGNPYVYLSERELARRAGVSHTLIQQILRNPEKITVQAETARDIETALNVSPGTFFNLPTTQHNKE